MEITTIKEYTNIIWLKKDLINRPPPPAPLSERELGPIEPLTSGTILRIGQKYVEVLFACVRLGKKVEATSASGGPVRDEATGDELFYQTGRRHALEEVLKELGQAQLVSTIDTNVNSLFEQP